MAAWGYEGAYPYEDGAVVCTEEHARAPRHWLVNPRTMSLRGQITYPFPVSGGPRPAGAGLWWTLGERGTRIHLWSLAEEH